MTLLTLGDPIPDGFFDGSIKRILELQRDTGAIPWYDGGVVDPWNHTEAAMGLATLGHLEPAKKAYRFLQDSQLDDGSWFGELGSAVPMDDEEQKFTGKEEDIEAPLRDTNFAAYIATGAWHYYLLTQDLAELKNLWPHVKQAINWVVAHQSAHGDIRWAADEPRTPEDDALITGSASIYKSLECAILIAQKLGEPTKDWMHARKKLGEALRDKPHRFDRTWESKERYSMDWYYPVLAGAITGKAAHDRLNAKWDIFVAQGKGCRCVMEQPWVTVAETAELVMALLTAGDRPRAELMLSWLHQWRADCGAYWMGYQFEDDVAWPAEKPAWTAAAVILATDAITGSTPAAPLFSGLHLPETA
ncbi:MAG: hypothetical protein ACJAVO_001243 [Parvibaculaceae bacterium]|jgi:hypothetical protein|nr:prenyltransferase [Parvibaculaceae bacterium]